MWPLRWEVSNIMSRGISRVGVSWNKGKRGCLFYFSWKHREREAEVWRCQIYQKCLYLFAISSDISELSACSWFFFSFWFSKIILSIISLLYFSVFIFLLHQEQDLAVGDQFCIVITWLYGLCRLRVRYGVADRLAACGCIMAYLLAICVV